MASSYSAGPAGRRPGSHPALPAWVYAVTLALLVVFSGACAFVLAQKPACADCNGMYTGDPVDRPVSLFRVTQVGLPQVLRLEWSYSPLGTSAPTYEIQRRTAGTGSWSTLASTSSAYYEDTSFSWNTAYEYRVRVSADSGPPDEMTCHYPYASGQPWKALEATAAEVVASDNQTADSRYDLRYGNPTYLDFNWGSNIYRGGLFVGYAADPSRVGRSYFKFTMPSLPTGQGVWAATLNAYHLRNVASGTVTVGAYRIATTWSASTLKWSTTPTLGSSLGTQSAAYDPMNPVSAWKTWQVNGAAAEAMVGTGALGLALASTSEATNGWAYFAKKEYDSSLGPRVLVAYGSPCEVLELTVAPTSVTGGDGAVGQVSLTSAAPVGGQVVTLASSDTCVNVPTSVTVPAGHYTATFNITTTAPNDPTDVFLSASISTQSAYTDVWVYPP